MQVSQNAQESSPPLSGDRDLLIVGPGVLGRLVAQKWRQVLSLFLSFVRAS